MFGLMDRIPNGVDPMLTFLESYINQSGVDDMKASAEIITTVCHDIVCAAGNPVLTQLSLSVYTLPGL